MRELTKEEYALQLLIWSYLDTLGFERFVYSKKRSFPVLKPIVSKQPDHSMYFMLGTMGLIQANLDQRWSTLSWYDLSDKGTKHVRRDLSYDKAMSITSSMSACLLVSYMGDPVPLSKLWFMPTTIGHIVARCHDSDHYLNVLNTLLEYSMISEKQVSRLVVQQANKCLNRLKIPGVTKIVDPKCHNNILYDDPHYHKIALKQRERRVRYVKSEY